MQPDRVKAFWDWFVQHRSEFDNLHPGDASWSALTTQLEGVGIDSWEIGPAPDGGNFLAISPAGNPERLKITRRMVAAAPAVDGWSFLPAKPPKIWDREFDWSSRQIPIDATDWRFTIYRYSDDMMEIVLLGDPLPSDFNKEEKLRILDFVIESEIGEEILIEAICGVDINANPTLDNYDDAISISDIKRTLQATQIR